jgi:predicted metalloprotease with PDZ domain
VIVELPESWAGVWSGLPQQQDPTTGQPKLVASDFDTLLDSPLLLGNPRVAHFEVEGKQHSFAAVGELGDWHMERLCEDIAPFVAENARFWQGLPYDNYSFLLVFRQGGGGLEHANSTLVTVNPVRMSTPEGYSALQTLICHEYFHVFNVKRLRPIELGPFDYEDWPRPTSLWIAEGLTCYYTDILQRRANMRSEEWLLQALTRVVSKLQNAPGRLLQNLEQSSFNVWNNSLSGVNPSDDTVSYYDKGYLVGWLLDAQIRRASDDQRSLDDLMRLAYQRFGGERGFEHREFWALSEEVSGIALNDWFERAISSTEELDYQEALEWFGLQIEQVQQESPVWQIGLDPERTAAQAARFAAWQQSGS